MTKLPGVLAQIADVAGEDAAIAIAQARGGTQVYIPPAPGPDHWLTKLIGREAAHAVADALNGGIGVGCRVDLPLGPAGHQVQMRAQLDAMIAKGMSERDIALATGYSRSTIRRRRGAAASNADERQMTLF